MPPTIGALALGTNSPSSRDGGKVGGRLGSFARNVPRPGYDSSVPSLRSNWSALRAVTRLILNFLISSRSVGILVPIA